MANCLIVGCGAIGTKLAQTLAAQGHTVTGLKRHPPAITQSGIHYFAADITVAETLPLLSTDFEQVFFILAPDGRDAVSYQAVYCDGLNNLIQHFKRAGKQPDWFMVSSTSVYAQMQGEWVDEDSLAAPTSPTSQAIRAAEQRLINLHPKNCIVRFSGIYGPGREYLIRQAQQDHAIQQMPPYFTNRVHEQDCVQVLTFLLNQRLMGTTLAQIYLASDDDPATQWDVISWLRGQLRLPPPTAKTVDAGATQNKRCSNQRLKALGFVFQYSDFRAGYGELLAQAVYNPND